MRPDTLVVLGDVTFNAFEVPEKIGIGGDQKLVLHKLVGGKRVADALGSDDRDIAWRGRFQSSDATDRARHLDFLRRQGLQVLLTWDVFVYSVIIQKFEFDFERFYQGPYEISCLVLEDLTRPITQAAPPSYDDLVDADFTSAQGLSDQLGLAPISAALVQVQSALNTAGLLGVAPPSAIAKVQNALSGAQNATTAAIGAANGEVTGPLGAVVPGGTGLGNATTLGNAVSAAGQLSQLYPLRSLLRRMSFNLSQIGS